MYHRRYTYTRKKLDHFLASFPGHNIPDDLDKITFEFADDGALVDIKASDDRGMPLDSADFDGPALLALADDAIWIIELDELANL